MIYSGSAFPQWHGDAFIGALSGVALIRVAPDGAIWLLEDAPSGRLVRLSPPT